MPDGRVKCGKLATGGRRKGKDTFFAWLQVSTETRTSIVQLLETQRLKLLPFTLELKKATLAERARLAEMLEVEVPDAWPGADLLEALPFFIEVMEKDPPALLCQCLILPHPTHLALIRLWLPAAPGAAGVGGAGAKLPSRD